MLPWLLWAGAGGPVFTEFTITSGIAGQGYWYNRRGGAMVGSVDAERTIPGVGIVNRFGISGGDILINKRKRMGFVADVDHGQPGIRDHADVPRRLERRDRADRRGARREPRRRIHPVRVDHGATRHRQ